MRESASRPLYFLISLSVFLLDRYSKGLVEEHLALHESVVVIPGFFDLTHTRNTGVAFGFFADTDYDWVPYLLAFTSAVALVVILFYSFRQPIGNRKTQLGLMLVLGGAAGNLYDRINYGFVIDFLDVFYQQHHWPTFNVADSSISIGIGLLLLQILTDGRAKQTESHPVRHNQRPSG